MLVERNLLLEFYIIPGNIVGLVTFLLVDFSNLVLMKAINKPGFTF